MIEMLKSMYVDVQKKGNVECEKEKKEGYLEEGSRCHDAMLKKEGTDMSL